MTKLSFNFSKEKDLELWFKNPFLWQKAPYTKSNNDYGIGEIFITHTRAKGQTVLEFKEISKI